MAWHKRTFPGNLSSPLFSRPIETNASLTALAPSPYKKVLQHGKLRLINCHLKARRQKLTTEILPVNLARWLGNNKTDPGDVAASPVGRLFVSGILVVGLLIAVFTSIIVLGAMRDPTRSLHGMLSSAVWTTLGPHFVLINALVPGLGVLGYRWGCRRLSTVLVVVAAFALVGSSFITSRIVTAASAAGGSVNPIAGLRLQSMQGGGPDETVVFKTVEGQDLQAAIYRPPPSDQPAPIILYIHGGGFMVGSMTEIDADLRWFADQGWLVVSVEYRLFTDQIPTWDKAPADVACAAAWLKANAGRLNGDLERLALLGDSAGGNLAINLGYGAALGQIESACGPVPVPAAIVVQYPAVDPLAIYEHGYPVTGFEPKMLVSGYLGGDPYAFPERVEAVSSYTFLSDKSPPLLILEPEKDGLVPSWSVYRFADQSRLAGGEVELVRIPFANHVYNQIASGSIGNQARLSITRRYLLEQGLGPAIRN